MADRLFKLKFLGDISQAAGQIDKLGDKFGSMGGKTKAAMGAAAVGGAAIGAVAVKGFMSAISIAADYEHAIDGVATVAQATAAQEKQLYEKGREIGRRTAFTALEAAAAMEELAAQGVTVDRILNGAADATVNLAAAGGTNLVTAATAIAGTMSIWKVPAENLTDVTNRIAGAANVSKFGVEDMNQAIAAGGAVAKNAGVTYEDFLATVALTADAFNSGSDAGTGLKTFFSTITGKSKDARQTMKEYGLITQSGRNMFYDAAGNFLGMANAAEQLKEALGESSDFDRNVALTKIFGSDAIRAGAKLVGAGRSEFEAASKAMGENDAAAQAAQRLGNLKASLDQLKGSIEDIGIGLGEKLLPPLTKVAMFLAEWLPKIPTEVLLVGGAFAVFIGIISSLALVIAPLVMVAGALGIGLGALILTLGLVGAAFLAAIAIGVLVYKNWDTIKQKATELKDWIVGVFTSLGPAMGPALTLLGELLLAPFIPVKAVIDGIIAAKNLLTGDGGRSASASAADARAGLGVSVGNVASWGSGIGEFASGGFVPGHGPKLAIVHGGEEIRTPAQQRGGIVVNVTVEGSVHSDAGLARTIAQMLGDQMQRGALGLR